MAHQEALVLTALDEADLCAAHNVSDPLPWLAVVACWICFGSFAVPMKWSPVLKANVHPLVYQTYKTFWTFVTAHLVLVYQPFKLSYWGLLSGVSWVPAGVASIVAVGHVGIACGQAVWQVTIIVTSFIWGFFVLNDVDVRNYWGTALSLSALCLGVVGMTLAMSWKRSTMEEGGHSPTAERASLAENACATPRQDSAADMEAAAAAIGPELGHRRTHCTPTDGEATAAAAPTSQQPGIVRRQSTAVGIAAALFNGLWGGANLVPSHFSPLKGVEFTLSFAWGSMTVNLCMLVGYQLLRMLVGKQVLSLHFRVMAVPGFISGTLWSLGNFFALYVVDNQHLGQGIGNSLIQMSVLVGGIWGICYYRELAGHRICIWALFLAVAMSGVVGLALEKKTESGGAPMTLAKSAGCALHWRR
mmetsp:Transcript_43156/g.99451  ORF Transcript_43156/g.99451 Transcript_43156/m.99451 type:complete len:417 (-) Transcript_43156:154-1404(-)